VIEYGLADLPLAGQPTGGDRHLLLPDDTGVMAAVVDGLGHGSEAAFSAETAVATLRTSGSRDLTQLVRSCHERLRYTRGAVMSVAFLDRVTTTLTWIGVGNVEGLLIRPVVGQARPHRHYIVRRSGVVGHRLPVLRPSKVPLLPGDTLVMATDGVSVEFAEEIRGGESPQRLADSLLRQYSAGGDDALVLVIRWLGNGDA
jgi:serine phosphatase RsbU (regulator of sigma subunit)